MQSIIPSLSHGECFRTLSPASFCEALLLVRGTTLIFKGVYTTHRIYDVHGLLETRDDRAWFNG